MANYWAKRRKVSKLVRETVEDILIDYDVAAANSNLTVNSNANLHCLRSTNPVTVPTSSACLLDVPTTSDLPQNRPKINDQSENINSKTSKVSPNVQFESKAEDDNLNMKMTLAQTVRRIVKNYS
ncbi:Hypothetical predicted protein [Xyrichtys novacula]|uniref:Uncharacterized protein n=1 Tax=Xyrichtys novacula TaxID=13765 RepID=A0AAV1FA19_XYRNO|nr:Hypothetical predicted protein [Xyrichtys novacula]